LLIVEPTREQVDKYLEDRRLKGINTILVELIEHRYATNSPRNIYGDEPFLTPGDFSTPNERYFANADWVIKKAAEKGMLVLLTPAYVGWQGEEAGWYREMVANGPEKLRAYGQYLGRRYKDFANIVWVDGGDYKVPDKNLVRELANGIRSVDGKAHTYHASRGTAAMQFWGTGESWLTLNNIYTDELSVVEAAFGEYARSTAPFFLIEARYEGEKSAGAQTVRRQAYQAVLSGASGHLMGNNPVWKFAPGWMPALNSPGAQSLTSMATLFASRAWWTLEPDRDNTLLIAGVGSDGDRAVSARARNGTFAIAYLPSARNVTIDLSRLSAQTVAVTWMDPSNGRTVAAIGSPFGTSGSRTFRPPHSDAPGFRDWVLILEATR
jgi:hypothetical protein